MCFTVLQASTASQLACEAQQIVRKMWPGSSVQQQTWLGGEMQSLLNRAVQAVRLLPQDRTELQHTADLQALGRILAAANVLKTNMNNCRYKDTKVFMRLWSKKPLLDDAAELSDAAAVSLRHSAAAAAPASTAQAAVDVLSACATLKVQPLQLLETMKQLHSQGRLDLNAKQAGTTAQALAQLGERDMELLSAAFWIMAREHHWLLEQQQQQQQMLRPLLPQQQPQLSFDDLLSAVHVLWAIANLNVVSMADQVQAAGLQELSAVQSTGTWPEPQGKPTRLAYLQRLVYYVHAWLLDVKAGDGSGLAAGLTAEQLLQCKSALRQQLQGRKQQQLGDPTQFQTEVRAAVSQLPDVRQGSLQYEEMVGGLVLVDVVAEMKDGRKLAVEADGATHFTHQHGQLTGSTLYRNRALAARGYVVVCVNNSDWPYGSSTSALCAQQVLLQRLVKEALTAYEARSTAH
jgi:hypothetical protein